MSNISNIISTLSFVLLPYFFSKRDIIDTLIVEVIHEPNFEIQRVISQMFRVIDALRYLLLTEVKNLLSLFLKENYMNVNKKW